MPSGKTPQCVLWVPQLEGQKLIDERKSGQRMPLRSSSYKAEGNKVYAGELALSEQARKRRGEARLRTS